MEHHLEPAPNQRARTDYPTATLVVVGAVAVILIGMGLILKIDNLKGVGTLFALAYTMVLIWWLARSRPTADALPDFSPIVSVFTSLGLTQLKRFTATGSHARSAGRIVV
ncbi:hypothetical protein K2Z83_23075 [Oscillochloris sp. ZM17-4]|uniref:hypothetical protein n=1 Tax=Oscillochloris sp. ZM17-4 TaxID=2866714 RepID=UPI001C739F94|nr:hypothetical protein [Oscillochloris sp. ZM17-4]MBX0330543.1 hypothetical protein [Oscillochloris sp. ZM17-4]